MKNTFFGYLLISSLPFISLSATAEAKNIESISVSLKPYPNWVQLDAVVEPTKAATVSAQTSGRIIKLNYDINDLVAEGAPLLEITNKEQGAQLAATEADYAKASAVNVEAQQQLTRYQALFPKGAISKGEMDEAEANAKSAQQAVSAAKAKITQARESLNYTLVSAPFAGIVTQRHVEEGETVSPGQALYSGYSLAQMRAVTQIPQRYVNALKQQPKFRLTLANGKQINSEQLTLFTFVDPKSHSYKVRINLPDNVEGVIPGSLIKAQFISSSRNAIFVPESSLITMNELSAVYIQQNDKWVLNQVRTGLHDNGKVEILAGLSDGDLVAKDAYHALLMLKQSHKP
ncbi:efflux RND transporter periplasmic adaptor subunit [Shewanella schlegeliana]|uniref:Efflux RND transporter periplasmic adaptor subunit n=1 Tax=Shewanella schlegeliana TaxID=190308 RepID=A0ABS1T0V5_9GAMM|nr:efflux RND transporter periplasmic adaptor subunit [Shewanella schlegeliana]MBL4913176.1 efflux RND transporter periplasmic adaptor subunit [Shewanella schlegeliana]MCL1109132.1 efflux RND transporter periplasmic adaptor subunit [Shewanella schlegeliana]GIU38154.1 hemolysin D [Shewanella schlegeliana]